MKRMSLPKVLILGQPFNNDTGGGITLSNLMAGWDKDKLAVACVSHGITDGIDTEICDNYYQLGQLEHQWRFPFNLITNKHASGPVKFEKKTKQKTAKPKSKLRVRLIMDYFFPLLEYLGLLHMAATVKPSRAFLDWVEEYQPDIIYAQTSSRLHIDFILAVKAALKKPLVFHMMDDWPSLISEQGLFKNYWSRVVDREFRVLLDKSDLLLSISDFMSEEYKRRYGKDFLAFHNPIDLAFWNKYQRNNYDLGDTCNILYAGRTGLGIDTSLLTMAKAVQGVNQELDLSVKLIIQTGEKPSWVDDYDCLIYRPFVAYEDLPRVFSAADFLILPYDFSIKSIKYIKYSMPTKASEYMMSGTPVIVFAPEETALVQYAKAHQWAEVITENQMDTLASTLKLLILEKDRRKAIAERAKNIASVRHNSVRVGKQFQKMLIDLSVESGAMMVG